MSNYKINKTEPEWKSQLTEDQFRILRKKGTESPYSGDLNNNFEKILDNQSKLVSVLKSSSKALNDWQTANTNNFVYWSNLQTNGGQVNYSIETENLIPGSSRAQKK